MEKLPKIKINEETEKKEEIAKNKVENLIPTMPLYQKFGSKEGLKLTNSTNFRNKGF